MVKFCLTGNDYINLCSMLKNLGNFSKNQDLASLELVLNLSKRPNKVEKFIQVIIDDKKAWDVVKTIYF